MTFETQGEPRRMSVIMGLLFEMILPTWGRCGARWRWAMP
jgi:hypothetical protein